MLKRVPDAALEFKPHPKSMTMGRLACHIAKTIEWGKATVEADELDFRPPGAREHVPFVPDIRKTVLGGGDEGGGSEDA